MSKFRSVRIFAVLSSMLVVGAIAAPANATTVEDPLAVLAEEADKAGYIIVQQSDGIAGKNGSVFFPTGEIASDTLVVIAEPDGTLPGGVTEEQVVEMVAERRADQAAEGGGDGGSLRMNFTYAYAATSAGMSSPYTGGSVWGSPGLYVGYNFNVQISSSQVNAAQGRGYYQGYNGTVFGTWQAFYGLGTASSSTVGSGSVPWGNVLSTKQLKARCTVTTVCNGSWQ